MVTAIASSTADGATPVPRDVFTIVARIPAETRAAASDATAEGGEGWIRRDRGEVGAIGTISSAQSTRLTRQRVAPIVVVVGRYAVDAAELAVDVYRLERSADDSIVVARAPFTPWHGNRWAVARKYLTAAEAADDPTRTGRNPFASFVGASTNDPLFHRIDWAAAQTALGHAIVYYRAQAGALARVELRLDVTQTHTGGWLHRTYTNTEHVIAHTNWLVATPTPAQPWASVPSFCVVMPACAASTANCAAHCPDPALVASAGAAFDDWTGPSLSAADQQIAQATTTSSGWTVIGLGAVTSLLAPALGPLDVAAGLSTGSPVQLQPGLLAGADTGVATPTLAPGSPLAAIAAAPLQQAVFGPESGRLAAVQAGYAATVVTPSAFQRDRAGAAMLDSIRQYRRCEQMGLVGAALRQCAAPTVRSDPATPR